MGAVKADRQAQHHVEHAGRAVGRMHLAQHCGGVVRGPVDGPIGLSHRRPGATPRRRLQRCRGLGLCARCQARQGQPQHRHGGLGDFVPVQAALGGLAHRKAHAGPHLAAVEIAVGLDGRHAPLGFAIQDGPVQRRGPAVARDAGVDNDAAVVLPHRVGDAALEEGSDDELGPPKGHGFFGDVVVDVELDRDLMSVLRQLAVEALRQAVEGVREEQDAHGRSRAFSRSAAAVRR